MSTLGFDFNLFDFLLRVSFDENSIVAAIVPRYELQAIRHYVPEVNLERPSLFESLLRGIDDYRPGDNPVLFGIDAVLDSVDLLRVELVISFCFFAVYINYVMHLIAVRNLVRAIEGQPDCHTLAQLAEYELLCPVPVASRLSNRIVDTRRQYRAIIACDNGILVVKILTKRCVVILFNVTTI